MLEVTHSRHTDSILGEGNQGIVFECKVWGKIPVAVKRIQLVNVSSNEKEEGALRKLDHPNVVKLFHAESDYHFRYYYLELCSASLERLFLNEGNPKKYYGLIPPAEDVLYQLAIGLQYIHNAGLIHRDLKPENVLIWESPNKKQVLMKWADFGLSKRVNESGSYSISGVRGTFDWIAPELLKLIEDSEIHQFESEARKRGTIKSDVFTEGLVFGYFLLKGTHLFGSRLNIQSNIDSKKPENLPKIEIKYRELIGNMIEDNPDKRFTSLEVVQYLEQNRGTNSNDSGFLIRVHQNLELKSITTPKLATELQNMLFHICKADTYPSLKEIETLIGEGVDINRADEYGWTALLLLTQWKENGGNNLIDLIQYFIKKGVDLNYREKTGMMNALHFLCGSYQKENLIHLIRLLIDNKIEVNSADSDGSTALHLLCNNYNNENLVDVIRLLIQCGIDVNCKNKYGWNAIHFLCRNYKKENLIDSVQYLIDSRIDVNCQNNNGSTALHLLCDNYQHENLIELIRLLIKSGIQVNYKEKNNRNALYILCKNYRKKNLIECVQILIKNGCDVTAETKKNLLSNNNSYDEIREVIQLLDQYLY